MPDDLPPDIVEIDVPSAIKGNADAILGWHLGAFQATLAYEDHAFIQHVREEYAIAIAEVVVLGKRSLQIDSSEWPGYLKFKVGARRGEG